MCFKRFFLSLLLVFSFAVVSCAEQEENIRVTAAEDFSLKDIDGNIFALADYSGKVIFLDFWATWCPPCRQSIPYVEELYQQYKDNGDFVVLGINAAESKNDVAKFLEKQKINYTVLLGNDDVLKKYSIRGIPAFFIIDQQGNIYSKYTGFSAGTPALWKQDIKKLLD